MNKVRLLILVSSLILLSPYLFSQENNDSIFNSAIKLSYNKNYVGALAEANKVLNSEPNRIDVLVFIANVYAWQHDYNQAKLTIKKAFSIDKTNQELYDSWLNILYWNNEPENLLEACKTAQENNYKDQSNLFLKRLQAYKQLKNYSEILALFKNEKNKEYLSKPQVMGLYQEVLLLSKNTFISAGYSLDFFDNNSQSQHLANIDYSFKIKEDRLLFRANWAQRFGINGFQLESDFYKMLKNKKYMYFNYGYSIDNIIFPLHRAGYEFYFPLKAEFESSLGARYMRFPRRNVYIATGHLSKYLGKSWLALRPFYVIQEAGNSLSLLTNYRLYADQSTNYWGCEFGYGNSPDDRFSLTQSNQVFRLNAYRFKLERNFLFLKTNEMKIGAAYASEEYLSASYRNRFTIELAYKFQMQ